jgi:hypothetical protein
MEIIPANLVLIIAGLAVLAVAAVVFWIGVKITSFITKVIMWAIGFIIFLAALGILLYKFLPKIYFP